MTWLAKWRPKDCIALLVIIVAALLLLNGIDTIVGYTLLGVVCAYYGIELPIVKIGKTKESKEKEGQ